MEDLYYKLSYFIKRNMVIRNDFLFDHSIYFMFLWLVGAGSVVTSGTTFGVAVYYFLVALFGYFVLLVKPSMKDFEIYYKDSTEEIIEVVKVLMGENNLPLLYKRIKEVGSVLIKTNTHTFIVINKNNDFIMYQGPVEDVCEFVIHSDIVFKFMGKKNHFELFKEIQQL